METSDRPPDRFPSDISAGLSRSRRVSSTRRRVHRRWVATQPARRIRRGGQWRGTSCGTNRDVPDRRAPGLGRCRDNARDRVLPLPPPATSLTPSPWWRGVSQRPNRRSTTGIELAHSRRRHADGPHTGTARRLSPPRVSRRPRDGGTSLRRAVRLRHRPTVDCRSRIGMSSPVRRQGVGAVSDLRRSGRRRAFRVDR
jgi:hypothetical protein